MRARNAADAARFDSERNAVPTEQTSPVAEKEREGERYRSSERGREREEGREMP